MAHGSDLPRVVADPDHGAQADERAAFTALYRSNFDYVWTQLRRLGVEEGSLEDAAQEVFLVVSRQLGDFAGRASIRTWLFAIARRIAFRFRRTAARTMRRHLALAQRQVEPAPSSLDAALQHHEAERLLAVFLRQLDDDKRAAFILGEIEGLGRVELGQALRCNPNTAYARLRAARQQFDRCFVSPAARAALLACAREPEPAPEAHRHGAWLLLTARIDGRRAPVRSHAAASRVGSGMVKGMLVTAGVGALAVLASMLRGPAPQPAMMITAPVHESPPEVAAAPVQRPDAASGQATRGAAIRGSSPLDVPFVDVVRSPLEHTDRRPDRSRKRPRRTDPLPVRASLPVEPSPPPAPEPSEPAEVGSGLAEELALLGQARRTLAVGRAGAALELLAQHSKKFPVSTLRPARAAMRISALCRGGDEAQARDEAAEFLRAYPASGLAEQVRASCPVSAPVTTKPRAGD